MRFPFLSPNIESGGGELSPISPSIASPSSPSPEHSPETSPSATENKTQQCSQKTFPQAQGAHTPSGRAPTRQAISSSSLPPAKKLHSFPPGKVQQLISRFETSSPSSSPPPSVTQKKTQKLIAQFEQLGQSSSSSPPTPPAKQTKVQQLMARFEQVPSDSPSLKGVQQVSQGRVSALRKLFSPASQAATPSPPKNIFSSTEQKMVRAEGKKLSPGESTVIKLQEAKQDKDQDFTPSLHIFKNGEGKVSAFKTLRKLGSGSFNTAYLAHSEKGEEVVVRIAQSKEGKEVKADPRGVKKELQAEALLRERLESGGSLAGIEPLPLEISQDGTHSVKQAFSGNLEEEIGEGEKTPCTLKLLPDKIHRNRTTSSPPTSFDRISYPHSPFTPTKAALAAIDITQGLVNLHDAGMAHRDLKPEQILTPKEGIERGSPGGNYCLSDFGQVHFDAFPDPVDFGFPSKSRPKLREKELEEAPLTEKVAQWPIPPRVKVKYTTNVLPEDTRGTAHYCSPEILALNASSKDKSESAGGRHLKTWLESGKSGTQLTQAADNWALGLTLYELYTHEKPLPVCIALSTPVRVPIMAHMLIAKNLVHLTPEQMQQDYDTIDQLDGVSEDEKSVLKGLLDLNPETRMDAKEAAERLEKGLQSRLSQDAFQKAMGVPMEKK